MSGLAVFDPLGDQVGRVRDVVVVFRHGRARPQAIGLVVEVPGRRRVFLPMTRVTSIDPGQVISTGLVNMRRFEQRAAETLVLAELLDREVELRDGSGRAVVEDVAHRVRAGPGVGADQAVLPPGRRPAAASAAACAAAARRCSSTTTT